MSYAPIGYQSTTPAHPNTKLKLQPPHLPYPASTNGSHTKSKTLIHRITNMIPFYLQHRILTSLLVGVLLYYIITIRSLAISTPTIYASAWPKISISPSNSGTYNSIYGVIIDMQLWRLLKRALVEGMAGVMIGREVVALQRIKGGIARDGVIKAAEKIDRRDRGWEFLGWTAVYVGLVVCGWGAIVR